MEIRWRYQDAEVVFSIEKAEIFIGRANQYLPTDVDLSPDTMVSRTHARIWSEDGKWWIEDLASKFGTFVNNEQVESRRELASGDRIRLGESELEISF